MVNELLSAIAQCLERQFGDNYRYYMETTGQEYQAPCFVIEALEQRIRPFLGKRQECSQQLMITYYPFSQTQPAAEFYEIQQDLVGDLQYLPLNDGYPIRGTNIRSKVKDGVGYLWVDYKLILNHSDQQEKMEVLDQKMSAKGG